MSSVTQKLMAAGSFEINLKALPRGLFNQLNIATRSFSLIAITAAPLDPTEVQTAASIRAAARYVGVYRSRPKALTIAGAGLAILLGDEDGKGPILSTAVTRSAGTLSNWVTDLLTGTPNGISAGTVTNTGTNHTQTYQYVGPRAALGLVCEACNAEWRINNTLTVDAAAAATLWTWTPVVLAMRGTDGRDPSMLGIRSVEMDASDDCEDYSTKTYVLARRDGGMAVGTATAGAIPYYGPGGATIRMERVIDGASVQRGDETNVATQQLARFSSLRRAVSLTTDDPDIVGKIRPGDRLYVWDPESAGLYDTTNYVNFRGQDTYPVIVRVMGYTWPIRPEYGVYLITSEATPVVYDLTRYVEFDTGSARLEIGGIDRTLVNSGIATGDLSAASPTGSTPLATAADAWPAYTPTLSQGASVNIAKTLTRSSIFRIGRAVIWQFRLDVTGAGTAGAPVTLTTPVTLASGADGSLGPGEYYDASVQLYSGNWVTLGAGTTTIGLRRDGNTNGVGQAPSFAVAAGDVITGTVILESSTS